MNGLNKAIEQAGRSATYAGGAEPLEVDEAQICSAI